MNKLTLVAAIAATSAAGAITPQFAVANESLMGISYQIASAKHDSLIRKRKDRDKKTSTAVAQPDDTEPTDDSMSGMDHSKMNHGNNSAPMDHATMDHSSMAHSAHHHGEGMWMFEYRYMRMYQEGMLDGAKSVDPKSLLMPLDAMGMDLTAQDQYPEFKNADGVRERMVSENMTMDMHMFMAMYAFSDKTTGMIMFNYLVNKMEMTMQDDMTMPGMFMNMPMDMETSGIGDTQVGISYKLDNYFLYDPLLSVQLSIPTGSIDEIDEKNVNMDGSKNHQPYSMQLGTGSYDFLSAISFKNKHENWNVGVEGSYIWRMKNEQNYSRGNAWRVRGWTSYDFIFDPLSLTLRAGIDHNDTSMIEGRDTRITENPMYYGGMRTDLRFGVSLGLPFGIMTELQYAIPLHQDVHGYQMKDKYLLELAAQVMF